MELFDLTGKAAVVTGGGTGLGEVAARALAEAGASLVICGRNRENLERVASDIESSGGRALPVAADVTLRDDVEHMASEGKDVLLRVAGSGAGEEAELLRCRMADSGAWVEHCGALTQRALADLMRQSAVLVLPSFYEGLPLVLVEALACGCRLICTSLPSVERELKPRLGRVLKLVAPPRLFQLDSCSYGGRTGGHCHTQLPEIPGQGKAIRSQDQPRRPRHIGNSLRC